MLDKINNFFSSLQNDDVTRNPRIRLLYIMLYFPTKTLHLNAPFSH